MTKPIPSIILSIAAFTLLAGCGEAFRSQSLPANSGLPSSEPGGVNVSNPPSFNQDGFRQPVNLSGDDRILQMYQWELQGRESLTIEWSNQVRAIDLSLTHDSTAGTVRIETQVHMSCQQTLRFQSQVSRTQLLAGTPLILSSDQQNASVRFQCLDRFCQEVVLAVTRHSGTTSATVLVGMAANLHQGQTVSYMSRGASRTPYFSAYPSGPQFRQVSQCQTSQPRTLTERIVDRVQEEATDFLIREANDFLRRIF